MKNVKDDTQIPGLTKALPFVPESPIALNPWGKYTPPPWIDAGVLWPQELVVTNAPTLLGFPDHEHISFDNQGLVTIQISKNGSTWYDYLPSGRVMVLDFHREANLWVRTSAGNAVLVVVTW